MQQLKRCLFVILPVLVWWPLTSFAQTFVCPNGPGPGEIQVGTTGGSGGVAVIPICASDGSETSPESAPEIWETRWGAIATGSTGWGAVTDMRSERQAKKAAIKQCKKTARDGSKCKADTYYNQCAVVVIPSEAYAHFFQSAVDLETATSLGMKTCSKKYGACEIYYSGCSYAKRID
jgi:Domain of unknown function (DUF4189)